MGGQSLDGVRCCRAIAIRRAAGSRARGSNSGTFLPCGKLAGVGLRRANAGAVGSRRNRMGTSFRLRVGDRNVVDAVAERSDSASDDGNRAHGRRYAAIRNVARRVRLIVRRSLLGFVAAGVALERTAHPVSSRVGQHDLGFLFVFAIQHRDIADALHKLGVTLRRQLREQFITLLAIANAYAYFDELVRGQRTVQFLNDSGAEAALSDHHYGVLGVRKAAQVFLLSLGQRHFECRV